MFECCFWYRYSFARMTAPRRHLLCTSLDVSCAAFRRRRIVRIPDEIDRMQRLQIKMAMKKSVSNSKVPEKSLLKPLVKVFKWNYQSFLTNDGPNFAEPYEISRLEVSIWALK